MLDTLFAKAPTDDRLKKKPKAKPEAKELQNLSDPELLAILLRKGPAGKTAVDFSHELLEAHGGLRQLLTASQKHVSQTPGFTEQKWLTLQASLELGRRHWQQKMSEMAVIRDPESTKNFLISKLRDLPYEVFCCLYLDSTLKVIAFEELFRGTVAKSPVYPREVVKRALALNASHLIFAHNHPSGEAAASQADLDLTELLKKCLKLMGIGVLDHFVIGDSEAFSFAAHGLL